MSNTGSEPPAEDQDASTEEEEKKAPYVILPYMGEKGNKIVVRVLRKRIPEKIRPKIVYEGTKLSTFFSTKDKVKDMHCIKLVYCYKGSGREAVSYTHLTLPTKA